jgi:hypothetical protein
MFLVHLGLVGAILAVIMLPRVFAIHFDNNNSNVSREEYDYR